MQARELAHDPGSEALQPLLRARELRDALDRPLTDDHVGAGEDRRDQVADAAAVVLVVGVGVDDDVGAEP